MGYVHHKTSHKTVSRISQPRYHLPSFAFIRSPPMPSIFLKSYSGSLTAIDANAEGFSTPGASPHKVPAALEVPHHLSHPFVPLIRGILDCSLTNHVTDDESLWLVPIRLQLSLLPLSPLNYVQDLALSCLFLPAFTRDKFQWCFEGFLRQLQRIVLTDRSPAPKHSPPSLQVSQTSEKQPYPSQRG